MKDEVTLCISSCGRLHLLEQTLESILKHNNYPLEKTIIIDDSGKEHNWDAIVSLVKRISKNHEIILNEKNIGQYESLDIMYPKVTTEWIFHCEDDWEFYHSGWIEESLEVHNHYGEKLFTCDLWGSRIKLDDKRILPETHTTDNGLRYKIINPAYKLGGMNQNPGIRRTETVALLYPYASRGRGNYRRMYHTEATLAKEYIKELGYRSAWVVDSEYVDHIGWGEHIYPEPVDNKPYFIGKKS